MPVIRLDFHLSDDQIRRIKEHVRAHPMWQDDPSDWRGFMRGCALVAIDNEVKEAAAESRSA